jgi:hypothetical protein
MAMSDKFLQLASECQAVIVITGDPAQGRFELANATEPVTELVRRENFVGLFGMAGITPKIALAVELDEAAIGALDHVLAGLLETAINRTKYWLENNFKNHPTNHLEGN